jgi:hypothetical protein
MITLDRFNIPIEIGDIVTFSRQNTRNSYGTTFTVEWYEGVVHGIHEQLLAYHDYNRELVIEENKYGEQCKATCIAKNDSPKDLYDYNEEFLFLQSNSVINKTKTISCTKMAYPKYFI